MNATTIRRQTALLLDDDPVVLQTLGTLLEARGFHVLAAADAESGIELLIDGLLDLDVLVADADLPGRDGASLLHLVRGAGGERDLAVVVLTGPSPGGLRARLLELGADAVVDRALGQEAAAAAIAAVVGDRVHLERLAPSPSRVLDGVLRAARHVFAPAREVPMAPA